MATELFKVAWPDGPSTAHIIFVHGLGGHPLETWDAGGGDGFWPEWVGQDLAGALVWTLGYDAPHTSWTGSSLHLTDRANSAFERLITTPELRDGNPVIFIGHSLGGLLIKQVLRFATDQSATSPQAAPLLNATKGIVFIATPHAGSAIASWADVIRTVVWPSEATLDLVKNNPSLRDLNNWFRSWSNRPRTLTFFETTPLGPVGVVDPMSADGGLSGRPAIPIERDHMQICKLLTRRDQLYVSTLEFIRDALGIDANGSSAHLAPRAEYTMPQWPNRAIPILVRLVALLLLVGGICWFLWPRPPAPPPELIANLTFHAAWDLPPNFPGGAELLARLGDLFAKIEKDSSAGEPINVFVSQMSAGGKPEAIEIKSNSPLYPSDRRNDMLTYLIALTDADVSCFSTKAKADKAQAQLLGSSDRIILGPFGLKGDYAFSTEKRDEDDRYSYVYNADSKLVTIWIGSSISPDTIRKNAEITYVSDLEASTCFLTPSNVMLDDVNHPSPVLETARKSITNAFASISASGRSYRIRDPERLVTKNGYVFFRFDFPSPDAE
ncbi:esterase/lipase family protein [Agrobacterium burrii]|uniref:AB hydrolase-1 domain-containing protein n=1 Tax=Agrobacterium burrii TaxID=2815339 RepID=A0ABS3ERM1_9HYPH|nr:alpha/beta hydrolase [Agrobacterium burrii]MBO0134624.1 hypothetical protein [Agrobacterium burrii]